MEKKQLTNEILISLLMLLFLYAGTMKILHFGTFKEEMAKQIFPSRIYACHRVGRCLDASV